MKNFNGEEYQFEQISPNIWKLTGAPQLVSVYKNNQLVTQDTENVDTVNYSGRLTLSCKNHINNKQITQINLIQGIPQYVTN